MPNPRPTTTHTGRTTVTDYPIGTNDQGQAITATLTCWHDKNRGALLAQLQRFTIAADGTRTEQPGHSTRIQSKMLTRFSKGALDGFSEYAISTVDEMRFDGLDDSYSIAVRATFDPAS